MFSITLERRPTPSRFMLVGAPLLALLVTVLISAPVLLLVGLDPVTTLRIFFLTPLSTANGLSEWLLKASPLILIALGLAVGFRASVWNIGAEGMYIIGAICAAWPALHFGDSPHAWLLPAMMLAGALGGAAWAAIPAFLKAHANTSEILVSLMMNYLAALLLDYLVNGPMQDPNGLNYPQTALFGPSALFSTPFPGMRLNASVLITALAVPAAWVLLERSFLGFQLRVSGAAPAAARYAGFGQKRLIWLSLSISGATSGLAGMMEAAGPLGQLTPVISPGYGFAAIIVACIGRLQPLGIVCGGLLLSLFYLGGESVQMALNVPSALSRTFQGTLLLFLLAADILIRYRLKVGRRAS